MVDKTQIHKHIDILFFVVPSPYYPMQNHARTYKTGDMGLITTTHSKPCISKIENTGLISIPETPSKVHHA